MRAANTIFFWRWEVGVNTINALIRVYGIVRARYVFGGRNNRVITPTLVRVTLEIILNKEVMKNGRSTGVHKRFYRVPLGRL